MNEVELKGSQILRKLYKISPSSGSGAFLCIFDALKKSRWLEN